jgi:hypothetical protein
MTCRAYCLSTDRPSPHYPCTIPPGRNRTDMTDPHFLAGDADRSATVEQLSNAMARGRLTLDEFDSRVTAAWSARTYGQLAELTSDLPPASNEEPKAQKAEVSAIKQEWLAYKAIWYKYRLLFYASCLLFGGILGIVSILFGDMEDALRLLFPIVWFSYRVISLKVPRNNRAKDLAAKSIGPESPHR